MTGSAYSGMGLDEISVEAAHEGRLGLDDIRISREALLDQADVAQGSGFRQLAVNLRRAAELTALSTEEVLAAYEALRPRRSSFAELHELAENLDERGASTCAEMVREAASVYQRRNLLR